MCVCVCVCVCVRARARAQMFDFDCALLYLSYVLQFGKNIANIRVDDGDDDLKPKRRVRPDITVLVSRT